jgi:hypothetical protein
MSQILERAAFLRWVQFPSATFFNYRQLRQADAAPRPHRLGETALSPAEMMTGPTRRGWTTMNQSETWARKSHPVQNRAKPPGWVPAVL